MTKAYHPIFGLVYIIDILVGTKTKEEYNEIVKEILKKLKENNLYVKLKKYIGKVRRIGFLEIVIGSNRIEMKKEKMNRVLSQLKPKNIKNIRKFLDLTNYYRRFIKDFM